MKKTQLEKKDFSHPTNGRKIPRRDCIAGLTLFIGLLMGLIPQKMMAQQCKKAFAYTGADQTFTVPAGITSITIKAWGAGGGGNNSAYYGPVAGGAGGGYSTGTLAVTPGDVLIIRVGQGGVTNGVAATFAGGGAGGTSTIAAQRGSSGGGYAGVFITTTPVIIAGGGGGGSPGADTLSPKPGGGGGTTGGQDGVVVSGKGGTQAAGGAAGTGGNNGIAGSYLTGGAGGTSGGTTSNEGGGGGGGGYYGGGGGAGQGPNYNGGGGGGSSYIGYSALSATSTTAGANGAFNSVGGAAANNADSDYAAGIGNGVANGAAGNGRVVIVFSRTISGNNAICTGTTSQLTVSPSGGTTIAWVSSNTTVATVNSSGLVTGVAAGSATITYTDSGVCTLPLAVTVATCSVCYNNANTATVGVDTKHGITTLQRAGAENGNWPMIRKSAHTVLESNTKGFVITRMSTAQISAIVSPQEGMMVYDTDAKCLKINSDGTTTGWSCFNTAACP